jgi:maltose alpha-D-glucosyltransferase/alpha-amylase
MDTRVLPTQAAPARPDANDPLWFKDAIIYQLHVKAFYDSNGDGIGDFKGLTEKLDYIRDLGVNTIWLMPFYPSPMLDDGYDVADYASVHPPYGTRADVKRFVREAHERGLRVITELVINHTSDQHPWFQAARRAPRGSLKRDYYVWSDDPNKYAGTRIIFTDTESSNWAWDPLAQQHYWHRFFSHQPDLNYDNPHVLRAVLRTMHFWLDMGVDGFRLDAIPYLVEREGTNNENLAETHAIIKKIRADLDKHYTGKLLLAEANQWPEDVRQYFGEGDECHMAYHFPMMPRLYMSIAMEDRYPLVEILGQTPEIPPNCQWAIFLRNHDELTLEMVTDRERDYMYRMFANDPRMRVNVGIRRRLAPLMENNRAKIELISFLLMTMPGSPIVYYGDELGMGDNIYLGDRNGVRTPMQWTPDRNAGFSHADPQRLYLPPVMDAVYGYEALNVEAQERSASSLLQWTRRLIATRRRYKAFGRGTINFLEPGNRKVLAFMREHEGEAMLCVANLSRVPQAVELDLARFDKHVPVEVLGQEPFPPVGTLPYLLTLPAYGYFAFRLTTDAKPPAWHTERMAQRQLKVLVLNAFWQAALENSAGTVPPVQDVFINYTHERLRDEILLPYIRERRWFAAKGDRVVDMRLSILAPWKGPSGIWNIGVMEARLTSGVEQRYLLPFAIDWESRDHDPMEQLAPWGLAKVRRRERVGLLHDAFGNTAFVRDLARAMGSNGLAPAGKGKLRFSSTRAYAELAPAIDDEVKIPTLEQSNTAVFFGNRLFLKGYRMLREGCNPELEVGRFLTDKSPFPYVAPIAGAVEYLPEQGEPITIAVLQKFLVNQGDLWTLIQEQLARKLTLPAAPMAQTEEEIEVAATDLYLGRMQVLGQRLAELHRALCKQTGDPAFDPEVIGEDDLARWKASITGEIDSTFAAIEAAQLSSKVRERVAPLLEARERLRERVAAARPRLGETVKTRYHGDLHLGQVLAAQDDFIFIDFEGEPARPLAERRAKSSVLRDVAGMLRSFSYAAHALAMQREDLNEAQLEVLAGWEESSRRDFLAGYRTAAQGLASVPQDDASFDATLALFLLEKALYELRYEIANRPDWVIIPLRGLLELTS